MISLILGICIAIVIGVGFYYFDKVYKDMTKADITKFMSVMCWLSVWAGMLTFSGLTEVMK